MVSTSGRAPALKRASPSGVRTNAQPRGAITLMSAPWEVQVTVRYLRWVLRAEDSPWSAADAGAAATRQASSTAAGTAPRRFMTLLRRREVLTRTTPPGSGRLPVVLPGAGGRWSGPFVNY